MEWSDSLSINVHLIDEQHKQLVKLFDSLQKAKQINSNDQEQSTHTSVLVVARLGWRGCLGTLKVYHTVPRLPNGAT